MVNYVNPYGAVRIADGGTPRIITIKARENISGGYWIRPYLNQGAVGSGAETYAASDIEGLTVATQVGSEVIGLALTNIPSGTYGPCAMRGIFLLPALSGTVLGSVYGGWPVSAGSAGAVVAYCSGTFTNPVGVGPADLKVGKALTSADNSGQFVIVSVNI